MSKGSTRHTKRLAVPALLAGLAASTQFAGTALAQTETSLPQAAPYSAIHVQVVRWGKDPNLPSLAGDLGEPITWFVRGEDRVQVDFRRTNSRGTYLGFDDKGSWIQNNDDRKVYVWNLKARTLTLGAENLAGVPLNLKNPSDEMKGHVAAATGHARVSDTVTGPSNAGRNTPYIPPSVAGDGNAQYASGGSTTPAFNPGSGTNSARVGASTQVKGSAASITAGVLTFTNDAGAQESMKVIRPPNPAFGNPNAPKPRGSAGAWLAEDPTDKSAIITLNVTESGAVTGTRVTGMAALALKRIMNISQ